MDKSTHKVEVLVCPEVINLPQFDKLGLVMVFGGYPCLVDKSEIKEGGLIAYIPPDSIVPPSFQEEHKLKERRIKAIRMRKQVSMGLVIKAPRGCKAGDDIAEKLGIIHYEPGSPQVNSVEKKKHKFARKLFFLVLGKQYNSCFKKYNPDPPKCKTNQYDLDNVRRYSNSFIDGEMVWCTEKIHGQSSRYVYFDGKLHMGSHYNWKGGPTEKSNFEEWMHRPIVNWINKNIFHVTPPDPKLSNWYTMTRLNPDIEIWCKRNPGFVLYGEICGPSVQKGFDYGTDQLRFFAFDILTPSGAWLTHEHARAITAETPLEWVPTLGKMPFSLTEFEKMANGKTLVKGAKHTREGIVITPENERNDTRFGRLKLKLVGSDYLGS